MKIRIRWGRDFSEPATSDVLVAVEISRGGWPWRGVAVAAGRLIVTDWVTFGKSWAITPAAYIRQRRVAGEYGRRFLATMARTEKNRQAAITIANWK